MNPDFYGIPVPTFVPYEPLSLGVGVPFIILKDGDHPEASHNKASQPHFPHFPRLGTAVPK